MRSIRSTLTMNITLDSSYNTPEQRRGFFHSVLERLGRLPGVAAVGAVDNLPLSHTTTMSQFMVEGYANKSEQLVQSLFVTQDYFKAMGTQLLDGRFFDENDNASHSSSVIVNQAFVKAYLTNGSAVGQHVCLCPTNNSKYTPAWSTIVGVVANVRQSNLETEPAPEVYQTFWHGNEDSAYIAIRTFLPSKQLIPGIRNAVRAVDSTLAVAEIRAMDQLVSEAGARRRFETSLFSVFGGVALFLAAIGLYGVMAYLVKQRTTEIGIRVALGAQRLDILKLIMSQGMIFTFTGILFGFIGGLVLARFLSSLLYGIAPIDPETFVGVVILLILVAITACWVPAWRAMKIDPMKALRSE